MTSQDNVTHLNRDVRFEANKRPPLAPLANSSAYSRGGELSPHKKFVAKGHDAQLMDAQMSRLPVTLTTMSGLAFDGHIVKRDKYTITLRYFKGPYVGQDEIFYKHAIERVLIIRGELSEKDGSK